jgi:hypothetical protein
MEWGYYNLILEIIMAEQLRYEAIELTGKMITSVDPMQLGKGDFRDLTNMRYTDKGIRGIQGMEKINTTVAPKTTIGAAFHFKKEYPAESHLLIQGMDTEGGTSAIYDNQTAIPNQGNFSSTPIYTEIAGSGAGKFFDAPDGAVIYGNTKEMLLWGGKESRCSGFFVADTDDVTVRPIFSRDYTNYVSDFDTSSYAVLSQRYIHIASLRQLQGIKFYVPVNAANTSSVTPVIYYWNGTTWADVGTIDDTTSIDDATLAKSGSMSFASTVGSAKVRFFGNILLYWYLIDLNGLDNTTSVYMCTLDAPMQNITNQWDGIPLAVSSCQTGVAFSPGDVTIPVISAVLTDTDTFTAPPSYFLDITGWDFVNGPVNYSQYVHIGSYVPLKGISFIDSHVSDPATEIVYYWNGYAWEAVSSQSGSIVSGSITFADTTGTAIRRFFNGKLLYWYLISISEIVDLYYAESIEITYNLTVSQTTFVDQTAKIISKNYNANAYSVPVSYDNPTYINLHNFTQEMYLGFTESMQGLIIDIGSTFNNTAASDIIVSYFNGTTFVPMTTSDTTSILDVTFYKSGVVVWESPSADVEFTTSINNTLQLYYYRVTFTATPTNPGSIVAVDLISGIPTGQYNLNNYGFASMFQNRVALCNDQNGRRNSALIGAANTNCVFNGQDSTVLLFGDDKSLVAAVPFFSRFSNNFFENLLVGKVDSLYIVDGTSPATYAVYKIASMYGVAAAKTMTTCDIGFSGVSGQATRNIVIWQSSNSVVLWDGSVVYPINADIDDVFDQTTPYCIELSMLSKSTASYDEKNHEWHWFWASKGNTTLNMEYCFDVIRKKWFKIDRGTGNRIQLGVTVIDDNNNRYLYGATLAGYLQRLEYGQTFDGTEMTEYYHTGDIPLGGWMIETIIRFIKPIFKKKSKTVNNLQVYYYGDNETFPSQTMAFNVNDANHRTVEKTQQLSNVRSCSLGPHITHSFKVSMTTQNEDIGHEPIGMGIFYLKSREDVK